jgi:caffeoyl-CoA O-methyltransferase
MPTSEIISEPVEVYLARLAIRGLPPIFEEMHARAARHPFPIVGPEVGRFFHQLARLRRPKRILELGSGWGYSAIWWALGAGPDVEIDCTEYKLENIDQGQRFVAAAGVRDCIRWHKGDALKSARELTPPWDIIFVDIDKHEYGAALDFARGVMRPGDVLLFDNALRHGTVAKPSEDQDEPTRVVVGMTDSLYADEDFDTSLLPIRDGVLMAVRR